MREVTKPREIYCTFSGMIRSPGDRASISMRPRSSEEHQTDDALEGDIGGSKREFLLVVISARDRDHDHCKYLPPAMTSKYIPKLSLRGPRVACDIFGISQERGVEEIKKNCEC